MDIFTDLCYYLLYTEFTGVTFLKHISRLITCAVLSLTLLTVSAAESGPAQSVSKKTVNKADAVISYFDCDKEYSYADNVYCILVVTDDCEGAATDDELFITLTGQNGVSTMPINVNNHWGCNVLEYRSYYGYNKERKCWEAHSDSGRDGSYNLYIIRTEDDLTDKLSEITLMTTPNTWFAEGSWSIHSVYVYKLTGKMTKSPYSSYKAFVDNPEFDYTKSQYALLKGYTLDAASCKDGWDKVSVSLREMPENTRYTDNILDGLGYTGFPSTGAMRKTSYIIIIVTLVCVGITVVFALCVMLYRLVIKRRKDGIGFFSRMRFKTDAPPKNKYFR